MVDFVTSTSDVQLFPKRIKPQVKLTGKTAQAAAHQAPQHREHVKGNSDLRINMSGKKRKSPSLFREAELFWPPRAYLSCTPQYSVLHEM